MLTYDVGREIELSLKKEPIKPGQFDDLIASVEHYGKSVKNPALTVQIVAYNEGDGLLKCLGSILAQKEKVAGVEIVVVDNGLDKKTKSSLSNYNLIHVITNSNLGCSLGRNVGASFARAPLISFVDADGLVRDDYISASLASMQNPAVVAVRGKVLGSNHDEYAPTHYDIGNKKIPSSISAEGISVWRLDDYKKVGGFEASLAGGEGPVLCYRMVEFYGYDKKSFYYDPSLVLYHDFHSDKKHLLSKTRRYSIIKDALSKRYPLLQTFEKYYVSLRPKHQNNNASMSRLAEKVRAEVNKEFEELYDTKRNERFSNPSLVTRHKSYDFSVVIPCFNLGKMVWGALDSVLRQSINSVQVIIVDDASTDPETIGELEKLKKHAKVIKLKQNGGVARARNEGIKHAKAKYILCLDADDTIRPTYLEKAFNVFEAYEKAGIVSTWVQFTGDKRGTWKPKDRIGIPAALLASPIPTASCFRKSAWLAAGGYDETLRGYEDWDFWLGILENNYNIRVLPEIHFDYLVRSGSKVKTSNKNAYHLVEKIVVNHEKLYQNYASFVFASKHKELVDLRSKVDYLRRWGSKPRTRLKSAVSIIKKIVLKTGGFLKEAWQSKSPRYTARLFARKLRSLLKIVNKKLSGN